MRGNGGVAGPKRTPSKTVAPGVWSLRAAGAYQKQASWPTMIVPVDLYDSTTFAGIRTALVNNLASFKNASFYEYTLDGNETFISDGGGDMYDGGNYTNFYVNGSTVATNIGYQSATNSTYSTTHRYAALGYARPLMCMAAANKDLSSRFGWGKSGNLGADGGGSQTGTTIYTNATVNGFTVNAWMRNVYNAGDPSVNDMYATIGHPNWSSTFTATNATSYGSSTDDGFSQYESTSTNSLVICSLLSKNSGVIVTAADAQAVLTSITSVLKTYFGY